MGGFEVVTLQVRNGQRRLGHGTAARTLLFPGVGNGEACVLGRVVGLAKAAEGIGVLAVEVGDVDEHRPLGHLVRLNAGEDVLGPDDG